MNARHPISATLPAAGVLCGALLWAALPTAVAQEARTPAPPPVVTDGAAREGAAAATPRRSPATAAAPVAPVTPAAPAPFTPSEKVGADTAVRFPVDI